MHVKKLHNLKKQFIAAALIIMALISGSLYWKNSIPIPDKPDTLKLLYLDTASSKENGPLFKMQPQVTYNCNGTNLESDIMADLSPQFGLSPSADLSLQSGLSPSADLSLHKIVGLADINRTNTDMPLHLMLEVTKSPLDISSILEDIYTLSAYVPSITLSLVPTDISDSVYVSQAKRLADALQTHELNQVSLIWYPQDLSQLNLYDLDIVKQIGVVLHSSKDMALLNGLYTYFEDQVTLYVREDILSYNKQESLSTVIEELQAIYYLLAINYPKVDTIFSPCRTHPLVDVDTYYFTPVLDEDMTLSGIYYQLANKPWITFANKEVCSTSPFKPLKSQTIFSKEVEIILAPDSDIISNIPGQLPSKPLETTATYLNYKFNEEILPSQTYYPYRLMLDTTKFANGISRIKALSYDANHNHIGTQTVDITISNPLDTTRAPRDGSVYPLSEKPIYSKNHIPILMYHSILETVSTEQQNSCVEIDVLDAQMEALLNAGYTPINFKTLKDYVDGIGGLPSKPILITMDDGYLNNYTNAYPIYKKYGIQATLFTSPYYMKEENTERHFGWNAAREMESSGLIDIQCHGYNHTPLPYMSLKDLSFHVSHAFGLIEKNLGPRDVFVVAYPQFRNTKYTRECLLQKGIDFQITKLAHSWTRFNSSQLRRINVPNTMTPDELIKKIESFTM